MKAKQDFDGLIKALPTAEVREKGGELKQLGQNKFVEQMDHVSAALDTGKTAVEAA